MRRRDPHPRAVRRDPVRPRWLPFLALAALALVSLAHAAPAQQPQDDPSEGEIITRAFGVSYDVNDPRVRVLKNLQEVKAGRMDGEAFYRDLATLDLGGQQPRHFLIELKTRLRTASGDVGVRRFFGETFKAGGTQVEAKLLTWRRELVNDAVNHLARWGQFRKPTTTVYLAEIGSWPKETPEAMRFEGDIDISILSADLELAWQMKLEFDRYIGERLGMSAQAADTVCTAHGMAEAEVYVGRHGMLFAERGLLEHRKVDGVYQPQMIKQFWFERGTVGEIQAAAKHALDVMAIEARLLRAGPAGEPASARPGMGEPGLSLEMLRHLTKDVTQNPIFSDLDAFQKAAKYTQRSFDSLRAAGHVLPQDLAPVAEFVKALGQAKYAGPAAQVELIRSYFGDRLPWTAELGPTKLGKTPVTLRANEKVVGEFFRQCEQAVRRNVRQTFRATLDELRVKARAATPESARAVQAEMIQVLRMMEIERLVFEGEGIPMDPEVLRMTEDFRGLYREFLRRLGARAFLGEDDFKEYRFLEEVLRNGQGEWKHSMAMATMARWLANPAEGVNKLNLVLDVLDNRLLGELRNADYKFSRYLEAQSRTPLRDAWVTVTFGTLPLPAALAAPIDTADAYLNKAQARLNQALLDNSFARGVRTANVIVGGAIQGKVATGLIAYNLKDEIPAYVHAITEAEDWGQAWGNLATEVFRRRVPFGSVAEHVVMGRYLLAAWDTVVNFVPPLALGYVAVNIGQTTTEWAWRLHWTEQLDLFVDGLYPDATFVQVGEERISDALTLGTWRLTRLRHRGHTYDLAPLVETETRQIREMQAALEVPHVQRDFPLQHAYDGVLGGFEEDTTLRYNLAETDSVLALLEEMRENPHVGERLLDHLRDVWRTRWEQVKLNFLLKTVLELEERWRTDQARRSGADLGTLTRELLAIADELEVAEEVDAAIRGTWTSRAAEVYQALRDRVRGVKRELYLQPAVWDVYDEAAQALLRQIEVYHGVRKARAEAEAEYQAWGGVRDHGLRLLTGPVFLSGNVEADAGAADRWGGLPAATRDDVAEELIAIKLKHGAPGTLDSPFDFETLQRVLGHDVWKALWRQVQASGAPSERFAPHFPPAELAQRSPAHLRFTYHEDERRRLVASFEAHYRQLAAAQEADRLRQACDALAALVGELEPAIAERRAAWDALHARRQALAQRAGQLATLPAQLEAHQAEANTAGERVIEGQRATQRRVEALCKLAHALEAGGAETEVDPALRRVAEAERLAKVAHAETRAAFAKTRARADEAERLLAEAEGLAGELQAWREATGKLTDGLAPLAERVREARARVQATPVPGPAADTPGHGEESCLTALEARVAALERALGALEKGLADTNQAGAQPQVALDERGIAALRASVEEIRLARDTAEPFHGQSERLAEEETPRCVARAQAAANRIGELQAAEARSAIAACRLEATETLLARMPSGPGREGASRALEEARRAEGETRDRETEGAKLLQGCEFERAKEVLQGAAAGAACPESRQRIAALAAHVDQARQHEEETRTRFEVAKAKYGDCRYDEALSALAEARAHTRCEGVRERLAAKAATVEAAKDWEAKTLTLFEDAKAKYAECAYDAALDALRQAAEHTRCARYATSLQEKAGKVERARTAEEATRRLYAEAQQLFEDCRYPEALTRLRLAEKGTGCERYRQKIGERIALIEGADQDEGRARELFRAAREEAAECRYDAALAKLDESLGHLHCGTARERAVAERERLVEARRHEQHTLELFEAAKRATAGCEYARALDALQQALNHTQCPRYRARLEGKVRDVRGYQAREGEAEELARQAERLAAGGDTQTALQRLREAQAKTHCPTLQATLAKRLARVEAAPAKKPSAAETRTPQVAPEPPPAPLGRARGGLRATWKDLRCEGTATLATLDHGEFRFEVAADGTLEGTFTWYVESLPLSGPLRGRVSADGRLRASVTREDLGYEAAVVEGRAWAHPVLDGELAGSGTIVIVTRVYQGERMLRESRCRAAWQRE